jgi:hypothetical protein
MPDESVGIMNLFKFKNSIGPERIEQPEPDTHPPCFVNPSGEGDTVARTDHGGRWPQIGFIERIEGNFVWVSMLNPVVTVPAFPTGAKHPTPWRFAEYDLKDANGGVIFGEEDTEAECEATERLICAAPELLETAKALLGVLRCVPIELPGVPDLEQDPRAIAARALITRIEKGPNG